MASVILSSDEILYFLCIYLREVFDFFAKYTYYRGALKCLFAYKRRN